MNTFSIAFKSLLVIILIHLIMRHFSNKYLNDCGNNFENDLLNSSDDEYDMDYGYNNNDEDEEYVYDYNIMDKSNKNNKEERKAKNLLRLERLEREQERNQQKSKDISKKIKNTFDDLDIKYKGKTEIVTNQPESDNREGFVNFNNAKEVEYTEKEFNIENIKNDLEQYLDENSDKYAIDDEFRCNEIKNEVQQNQSKGYDLSEYERPTQLTQNCKKETLTEDMKKTKLDSCDMDNKLRYEEWVYKDENRMNGIEQYDGIFAYDNMVDNFCGFNDNPIIQSQASTL